MAADYTFPDDLIELRRDFVQAGRDLETLRAGTDPARRADLRARERDLAVRLAGHPYWQEYRTGEREAAREALRALVRGLETRGT